MAGVGNALIIAGDCVGEWMCSTSKAVLPDGAPLDRPVIDGGTGTGLSTIDVTAPAKWTARVANPAAAG